MYRLRKRLGLYSRFAGIGFIALSIIFLVLSVYDQFIVFEVDSVVAFVAAIVLLLRDPRSKVEATVFDASQVSTNQAIGDLSTRLRTDFHYVPNGDGVAGVELVASGSSRVGAQGGGQKGGPSGASSPGTVTPPGRGLAILFTREEGLKKVTMRDLNDSLTSALREGFGLASSAQITEEENRVKVVLKHPTSSCGCADSDGGPGRIGCTVASFIAVLVAAATNRPLSLEGCKTDSETDTRTVAMRLEQASPVSG